LPISNSPQLLKEVHQSGSECWRNTIVTRAGRQIVVPSGFQPLGHHFIDDRRSLHSAQFWNFFPLSLEI
jgi:hypothetical protein